MEIRDDFHLLLLFIVIEVQCEAGEFKFCRISFIGFIRFVTDIGPDSRYLSGKSK